MTDLLEEAIEYLKKYGNTREADLAKYLKKRTGLTQRAVMGEISKYTDKKQLHRIIHPTKPPSVYLSLAPQEVGEEKYTDLEPKRALQVARIDWVLNILDRLF